GQGQGRSQQPRNPASKPRHQTESKPAGHGRNGGPRQGQGQNGRSEGSRSGKPAAPKAALFTPPKSR
ncbi:RNA helicase, partial (plasmid) [Chromobacterium amazonense]|nr:RNA helicase [Chromobacterium amazonense]